MIRKASLKDMKGILAIIKEVIEEMHRSGSDQWNETYPAQEDFAKDIAAEELFVETDKEGIIRAFVCLNTDEPPEYKTPVWGWDQKALIIHRMAVNPQFRGQGLAKKMMAFAEERAKASGITYMKSDTYSPNRSMNSLFHTLQYTPIGNIHFPGRQHAFICYEKKLLKEENPESGN